MTTRKSLLLRINAELWEELSRWATQEFRSVNSQIEFLLQRSVDERLRNRRESGSAGGEPEPKAEEER